MIEIVKADADGCERFRYPGELVYRDEAVWVLRCVWGGVKPFAVGGFALQAGDLFIEHYFPGEWFNVFAVYAANGTFKDWYCNITLPAEFTPERIVWRDLALDLLFYADGAERLLDEDEFEELRLDEAVRAQAWRAVEKLRTWRAKGRWPLTA